ncbi:pitrilysin family protein [Hyphomonas sp. FCG-A18]|uniref:M16 family metallopeptidase n=1 Tax=Hyphomonas sp. FCG-A18 TaxID=3080019 RepID=UPI002B3244DC|nr:pitrilysin family protein [Hyphomonas sp. FCG-A18]
MRITTLCATAFAGLALVACTPSTGSDGAGPEETASELKVETHTGEFATIQQFTTPGGVSVWLVEEPSIPILSLRMAWEVGTTSDPVGQEGLTNAMVYQMNEGAGELDSQAFSKRMEELNMSFGCAAGRENTYCNASMLTDNAKEAFELIALAYAEPRFDEGPWERFVREQEVSLKTRETNPRYLSGEALEEALWPDHPYARDFTAESLAALSAEAAKAHKSQIMDRKSMIVTAVGAISPDELAPLIDKATESLMGTAAEHTPTPEVVLAQPVSVPILVDLPQPQSLITFTGPAMRRDDPDFYTAVVANYIFGGGGFESRLMKDLRVDRGLTYGIYTSVSAGDKLQTWGGSGQTKNESAGEFIDGIKDNMRLIVEEGVTEQELADAKAYLVGSYPLGFDSNAKIAGNMMGLRLDDLPVDFWDKRNAMVQAVTLEDVNRVAREYLQPENFTFIVVGEPEGLDG